jgi:serine/threonine protein kinase
MYQMLDALVYLDEKNVIHRDVKLDNILYDDDGNFYLADFGLSKTTDRSNTLAGSPAFIAPEVFEATVQTTKMDVWAIGMVALFVLDKRPKRSHLLTMDELQKGYPAEWFPEVVKHAATHMSVLLPMFQIKPEKRFSARECLERRLFETSPRDRGMGQQSLTSQSAVRQDAYHNRPVVQPPQVLQQVPQQVPQQVRFPPLFHPGLSQASPQGPSYLLLQYLHQSQLQVLPHIRADNFTDFNP